jgi:hypothetical protein
MLPSFVVINQTNSLGSDAALPCDLTLGFTQTKTLQNNNHLFVSQFRQPVGFTVSF